MPSNKRKATRKRKTVEESEDNWSDDYIYPSSIKRRRRFSVQETNKLEEEYSFNASPSQERLQQIANEIGTARKIVTTWFQNRRAKHKRNEKKEEAVMNDGEIGLTRDVRYDVPQIHYINQIVDACRPPETSTNNPEYTMVDSSVMYPPCMNTLQSHVMLNLAESDSWIPTDEAQEEHFMLPYSIETNDGSLYINPSQLLLNYQL